MFQNCHKFAKVLQTIAHFGKFLLHFHVIPARSVCWAVRCLAISRCDAAPLTLRMSCFCSWAPN